MCVCVLSGCAATRLQIVEDGWGKECARARLCCAPGNRKWEQRRNGTPPGVLYPGIIELSQCFDTGHWFCFNCFGPPPAGSQSEDINRNVLLRKNSCDTDHTLICTHMLSVPIILLSIGATSKQLRWLFGGITHAELCCGSIAEILSSPANDFLHPCPAIFKKMTLIFKKTPFISSH